MYFYNSMTTILKKLLIPLFLVLIFSCRKDSFSTDPSIRLYSSVDTVHFDTVFTTTGSATQSFKIINDNAQGINISSVRLAGGTSSPFNINVDGITGPHINNIDINANDSAYVFISVSINPTAGNLDFIVRDSIEIIYNGNKKIIQLDAFGRNAHFFRNKVIKTTEIWDNDLPYIILGRLVIDTNALLTINKGCRIYIHADAPFIVNGSLRVNGEKWDSTRVVFAGDRLDEFYRDFPAGYPGLIFTDISKNNVINYGIIKNAYQGMVVLEPSPNAGPKLTLNETIIDNAYDAGILGINTSISARNLLVSNCGKNLVLVKGGDYRFTHCTIATVSNNYIQHKDPVLSLSNFIIQNNVAITNPLNALFQNCIFWGESSLVENEVVALKQGSAPYNVVFDRVLWRVKDQSANIALTAPPINNQNPEFDTIDVSKRIYSFRLKNKSPAKNTGINAGVTFDLDGALRPVAQPDLGAYERQ